MTDPNNLTACPNCGARDHAVTMVGDRPFVTCPKSSSPKLLPVEARAFEREKPRP